MTYSEDFIISDGILKKYIGTSNSVTVPECVEYIDSNAFENCITVECVILPAGLCELGDRVFAGCTRLRRVTFRESPQKVGEAIFAFCPELSEIYVAGKRGGYISLYNCLIYKRTRTLCAGCRTSLIPDGADIRKIAAHAFEGCSTLETITIPEGVVSIGDGAFAGCSGLCQVTMADTVTFVGSRAFEGCKKLRKAPISASLEKISGLTFHGCSGIRSAFIPETVAEISGNPFTACTALSKITVDKRNRYYRSEGNCIIHSATNTVVTGCKSSVIPESVKAIGELAFSFSQSLAGITLPESVTVIQKGAFSGCSVLSGITIPKSVVLIGENALADCEKLEKIRIEGTPKLSRDAFGQNCSAVIVAPYMPVGSLRGYEINAINGMCSLYIASSGIYSEKVRKSYASYCRKNRKWLASRAASDMALLSYLTKELILDSASAEALMSIAAEKDNIEMKALLIECLSRLNSARADTDGDELSSDFLSDFSLESLFAPKSPSELKKEWKYIKKPDGTLKLTLYEGRDREVQVPETIGKSAVSEIGEQAFLGYENLYSVTVPGCVKVIGHRAFGGCINLVTANLMPGTHTIGREAFAGCSSLENVNLREGLCEVADRAFSGCRALKGVDFPATVSKLGDSLFAGCSSLCELSVREENPYYFSLDRCVAERETGTLVCAAGNAKIPADARITALGQAFAGNTVITEMYIPDNITYIECNALDGCVNLIHVRLPEGLAEIPGFMFCGCEKLERVEISAGTSEFGIFPFDGCPAVVIYAPENSPAQVYAEENGIAFCAKELKQ